MSLRHCLKRGRLIGSPRKRKRAEKHDDPNMKECILKEIQNKTKQEIENPECIENNEISIGIHENYGIKNHEISIGIQENYGIEMR